MPKTLSNPVHIGSKAPTFTLPEPLTGKQVALSDFASAKAVLVAFISNSCPSVKLIDAEFNRYARCTPDLYLFDAEGKLFYHGQFDDARPGGAVPVTGADLRDATDRLLKGEAAPATQKNAIGCNIKWRDGDEKGVRAEHKLAA